MEWTPSPAMASRLMKSLQSTARPDLSTLLHPDGRSTAPGEETAHLLFDSHFPQSTQMTYPHYVHKHHRVAEMEGRHPDIVSDDLVRQAFSEFQSKKTPGPDGLKPVVLFHLPPNTIRLITVVYKSCLTLRYTPRLWRDCYVIFIPKPGKNSYEQASAFRPIALSNYFLKALERLCSWHVDRAVLERPIHEEQHGF